MHKNIFKSSTHHNDPMFYWPFILPVFWSWTLWPPSSQQLQSKEIPISLIYSFQQNLSIPTAHNIHLHCVFYISRIQNLISSYIHPHTQSHIHNKAYQSYLNIFRCQAIINFQNATWLMYYFIVSEIFEPVTGESVHAPIQMNSPYG